MPSTVASVFAVAGLESGGAVPWGTPVPQDGPGVYVVALTDDPLSTDGARAAAPLDRATLQHLLGAHPELCVDGVRPNIDELAGRLDAFWIADEVVLYIGLAGTSVRKRVRQYYKTPLGAKRPHAGGWWLKTLSVLDEFWVHWATTPDGAACERAMLTAFEADVSPSTRAALHDGEHAAPFANLRAASGLIKRHGITGATGDAVPPGVTAEHRRVVPAGASSAAVQRSPAGRTSSPRHAVSDETTTQRITAKDFEAGRIRLPARSKHLLPRERADVEVLLRGQRLQARWDPRIGPPERSGVLGFGRGKLNALVEVDAVLYVATGTDDKVELT